VTLVAVSILSGCGNTNTPPGVLTKVDLPTNLNLLPVQGDKGRMLSEVLTAGFPGCSTHSSSFSENGKFPFIIGKKGEAAVESVGSQSPSETKASHLFDSLRRPFLQAGDSYVPGIGNAAIENQRHTGIGNVYSIFWRQDQYLGYLVLIAPQDNHAIDMAEAESLARDQIAQT